VLVATVAIATREDLANIIEAGSTQLLPGVGAAEVRLDAGP